MARNITLSIVEATFNEVLKETEHISPKMIELIENKLQNECGDMRYKLVAYAASNRSIMFGFYISKYYVYFDWEQKKWKAEYIN